MSNTGYLTPDEFADEWGVSTATVRNWISKGLIKAHPPTREYRILPGQKPPAMKVGRPAKKKKRRA